MKYDTEETLRMFEDYVIPNYTRYPVVVVRGEGSWLWDADGNRYLDMFPGWGVCVLGHSHPAVAEAVTRQLRLLQHMPNNFFHPWQGELAKTISERSFGGRCFFCNSGAEAVEAALKLARLHGHDEGRYKIVTMENSFHGRTFGAISATGQEKYHRGFAPLVEGFSYVPFNDLDAVEAAVDDATCAVMLELIQGEGGVNVAEVDFVRGLRRLCDEKGILLIVDEVQTGMGRTGSWFVYQQYGIEPDIMTLAKGLGGGLPIGACVARKGLDEAMKPGTHASTFGGNPVVCAAASAVFRTIEEEGLLQRAAEMGDLLRNMLEAVRSEMPEAVREVRGKGLMLGVELAFEGGGVVEKCLRRGLLINCTHGNVVRFLPALTVEREELETAVEIFSSVLEEEVSAVG